MRVGLCMSCAERCEPTGAQHGASTRREMMRNRAIHHAKRGAKRLFPRAQVPPVGPARVHCNAWLTAPPSQDTPPSALVLLNTPPRPASALRQLWSLSSYRVCADAAANRLRDSLQLAMGTESMVSGDPAALRQRLEKLQHISRMHESMVPDAVTGDFDSIRPDVLDFYRQRGCTIAHDPDANHTDFEKSLRLVEEAQAAAQRSTARQGRWTVVAFGAFGDRFDHELASINVLHRYRKFSRLILMGERMTACLLMPGRHVLMPNALIEGPTCGLLPIGGSVDGVWTSGLRWNLRGERLQFGDLVSSSNQMLSEESGGIMPISVTTTHPLVWTTVLRPDGWPHAGTDSIRPR